MLIDNCTQVNYSLQLISFTDCENPWIYTAARTRRLEFACDNRSMINVINFTLQIRMVLFPIFSLLLSGTLSHLNLNVLIVRTTAYAVNFPSYIP
jgi:hypothetical protein